MSEKCKECGLRQAMARAYDWHWLGEDDCPWNLAGECPVNEDSDE